MTLRSRARWHYLTKSNPHTKFQSQRLVSENPVRRRNVSYLVKLSITSIESNFNRNVRAIRDPTDSRLAEVDVEAHGTLSRRLEEINGQLVAAIGIVKIIE